MAYTPKPVRRALKRMRFDQRDRWKQVWSMLKKQKGPIQITTQYEN